MPTSLPAASLPDLRRSLLDWYAEHARPLPWRADRDAYRIWVSEVMLQQTTVAAVGPYFARFLERFPTVHALADAGEGDVLRAWEGLGYYSRARNLHAAAQRVVHEHGGAFPRTVAGLRELPGVGRYTAGAVAAFAFDAKAPIVEANTLRLYCRLLAYRGDPRSTAGQKVLWGFAESLLPDARCGDFNQALMELGGTVCTVKQPACGSCPVSEHCRAFAEGSQAEIPRPKVRPAVTDVTEACVAVRRADGAVLVRLREPGERWAGLWDFPRFAPPADLLAGAAPVPTADGPQRTLDLGDDGAGPLRAYLSDRVAEQTGVRCDVGPLLTEIRHGVTRYRIRLLCFAATRTGGRVKPGGPRWVKPDTLADLPLSKTGRRLADLLGTGVP